MSDQDKKEEQKQLHALEVSLAALEGQAAAFGLHGISDSKLRHEYNAKTKAFVNELRQQVKYKQITIKQAAEIAHQSRNMVMDGLRAKTSPIVLSYLQKYKKDGLTLEFLQNRYAQKHYKKPFADLSKPLKQKVWTKIIASSRRPNAKFNALGIQLGYAGKAFWVLSVGIGVHQVASADNKVKAVGNVAATTGGGILGSMAGGAVAGLACGPGALVCSGALVIIFGIAGSVGADIAFKEIFN
ncbi:hypothetical protein KCM76_22595 [Zooshikella marina]|uniref:hypothetical protein n=1 Tax=Zooshikella ganghwensis TaxID=202772 RepID=UPI001BB0279B|nr:hypothetical protein [Zooshikella ganghwensis]MBU2708800.1 hypothetical protein [Zooshikella ganghwensis]